MCKTESIVTLSDDDENVTYESVEKIDMSKFRAAYTYVNLKEYIANDLIEGRKKREELE